MEVDWKKHPDAKNKDILTLEEEIFLASIEEGVLLSRGSWFAAEKSNIPTQMFFRATFAAESTEKMTEAISKFGVAVREAFKLK